MLSQSNRFLLKNVMAFLMDNKPAACSWSDLHKSKSHITVLFKFQQFSDSCELQGQFCIVSVKLFGQRLIVK